MFNLLECIVVIMSNLEFYFDDQFKISHYIESFKRIIIDTKRIVKDRSSDYQGRGQVKVFMSNFINKCEYFTSKLDQLPMKNILNHNNNSLNQSQTSFKRSNDEELENLS
jgi:hypothetical protein